MNSGRGSTHTLVCIASTISIRQRLIATMAALGLIIAGVGVAGLYGMRSVNADLRSVNEDAMPAAQAIASLELSLARARLAMDRVMIEPGNPANAASMQRADSMMQNAQQMWQLYSSLPQSGEEVPLAAQLDRLRRAYLDSYQRFAAALRGHQEEDAQAIAQEQLQPQFIQLAEQAHRLNDYQQRSIRNSYAASQRSYDEQRGWTLAAIVLGGALMLLSGAGLLRAILHPLKQARGHFRTIAAGDLSSTIAISRRDEMGELLSGLQAMQDQLASTVSGVRAGASAIAGASAEIAAGNRDLSRRTERQAACLQETASSLESMTGALHDSAINARQANQLAIGASEVAVRGGALVAQVVETMGAISGSALKIGDIISVIDGIAFQTNILALNAAVEAARAGEQGRGFAVVAQEVRKLAQHSALAAGDIKRLVDDSVAQIRAGDQLAAQAGKTMHDIVDSVQRVTAIMERISAAGQEQEAGIGQIHRAVADIDAATQQNAALVEQAAAASHALQDQAQHLAGMVSAFVLEDTPALIRPPAPLQLA